MRQEIDEEVGGYGLNVYLMNSLYHCMTEEA